MRLDSASRAFWALVAVALAPYVALGVFGCGLLSYLGYRIADDGLGVLTGDADLRPAVAFFVVVSAGTVLAARSLWRQYRATRRLAEHVVANRLPADAALEGASERAGLAGQVDLVDSSDPWSFTYGMRRPRVAVSAEFASAASGDELDAVLAHERYHVRNLDPLKVVVARALSAAYFFLPVLGHLRSRYLAGRELAADRRALRTTGQRPLAAALYRVVAGPGWPELSTAAAIGGDDLLDIRVAQIESGEEPELNRVPTRAVAVTVVGLVLLVAALVATVVGVGGPGALMGMDEESDMMIGDLGAFAVLGGVACMAMWLIGGVALWRGVARRRVDTV